MAHLPKLKLLNPATNRGITSKRKAPIMAKKSKSKKKTTTTTTTTTEAEPELSPRETERLELVAIQADEKTLGKSWDEFANDIESTSHGVKEAMQHSLTGALALGAKVVEFAKREEIQNQISLANHDKKGMPWKAHNWVAEQLTTVYSGLPSAKHLGDCARGYMRALENGTLQSGEKNLRKLLDWSPSAVPAVTGKLLGVIEDTNPAKQIPADKKDPVDPTDPTDPTDPIDPRAELITALHDANESVQFYVDKCNEQSKATDIKDVQEHVAAMLATLETI